MFVIVVSGGFANTDDYLDVQFRLLREDFVQPLREGIKEYQEAMFNMKTSRKRIQNVRIYQNVRIVAPIASDRGIILLNIVG